jgi:hypothetical protein
MLPRKPGGTPSESSPKEHDSEQGPCWEGTVPSTGRALSQGLLTTTPQAAHRCCLQMPSTVQRTSGTCHTTLGSDFLVLPNTTGCAVLVLRPS